MLIAKLFSSVIVKQDDENEDKNQWHDHPKRVDTIMLDVWTRWIGTLRIWEVYTSIHLLSAEWRRRDSCRQQKALWIQLGLE